MVMDNFFARLSIPHFFRWVLFGFAWTLSLYALILPGLIWHAKILNKTGGRTIDLLFFFVPIAGTVVAVRAHWRYCSTEKYWEPQVAPSWPEAVAA
jgi:hypothetical protein